LTGKKGKIIFKIHNNLAVFSKEQEEMISCSISAHNPEAPGSNPGPATSQESKEVLQSHKSLAGLHFSQSSSSLVILKNLPDSVLCSATFEPARRDRSF
jgi:hypothetical protein